MTRLFWKIFLALWLSIMGFSLLMAWVNVELARQFLPDSPEVMFNRGARKTETALRDALAGGGPDAARAQLQGLPRMLRNHVYLFDPAGHELLGRQEVHRHMHAVDLRHTRKTLHDVHGQAWTLVVLRRPPPRLLEPGWRGIVLRLVVAGLVSALVSFFLARYLARPLERLSRVSRELAAGDLTARVGVPLTGRRDEFGAVSRDLDDMAGSLQASQEANRRLLRDVSHELRSPLARLRVALEIARNRDGRQVTGELDRIERESERLEILIGEVLGLLRDSSGSVPLQLERFDLADLLQDLCDVVAYEMQDRGSAVQLEVAQDMPMNADRELLWRAFENLLRNALLHGGRNSTVQLRARRAAQAGWLEVSVEDSGPGIPEAELERVFEPFYRVQEARDRDSGGHGLGLAIAAAAVRRHGGRIAACNREGGGLRVTVALPMEA